MTIYEFADVVDARIELRRHPNQDGRWSASFEDCEVVPEPGILRSTFGDGLSPLDAVRDYAARISGQRLVFHATDPKERREYRAPPELSVPE